MARLEASQSIFTRRFWPHDAAGEKRGEVLPGRDKAEFKIGDNDDVIFFSELLEVLGFANRKSDGLFEEEMLTCFDDVAGHFVVGKRWGGEGDGLDGCIGEDIGELVGGCAYATLISDGLGP